MERTTRLCREWNAGRRDTKEFALKQKNSKRTDSCIGIKIHVGSKNEGYSINSGGQLIHVSCSRLKFSIAYADFRIASRQMRN